MQIYIAYKYTNIKNKNELKVNLEHLSQILESKGYNTFLLNRDAKAWGKKHVSTFANFFTIVKNIFISKILFAYVNSDVLSLGIIFELILAKILQKRIIICVDSNVSLKTLFVSNFAHELINYTGIKDLEAKIEKVL